ncbi:gliding motility lipoprotein GldD [uncultured Winogradskyella sp.]|uniref:gliding motility lipoprotein GldD n=1 Tax=uncultured Winogradskyella sp. TaxID=395353 RepID=UPI0026074672|nr:gliding motility lipoprotein GldD [uncultured Winogradskyella sp.]
MKRVVLIWSILLFGCGDDPLPKPKAHLRLDYPIAKYKEALTPLPFTFDKNELANPISKVKSLRNSKGIDINYSALKATIYLTYKPINNNLDSLIRDAQNLTQKHTMKADEISQNIFENPKTKVYGMLYEIGGDAASQSQFYVTDSTNHFLSGSLYFYATPNYDSIYPAAEYLKNDIKRIMESVRWKTK